MIKAAGHKVIANYVTLDLNLALSNNQKRFEETGRKVPEEYVRGVSKNIPNIVVQAIKIGLFDELHLFDTNIHNQPRKILSHVDGVLTIYDQGLYDTFLKQQFG
jgi:predicted ABC-type ATPase